MDTKNQQFNVTYLIISLCKILSETTLTFKGLGSVRFFNVNEESYAYQGCVYSIKLQ